MFIKRKMLNATSVRESPSDGREFMFTGKNSHRKTMKDWRERRIRPNNSLKGVIKTNAVTISVDEAQSIFPKEHLWRGRQVRGFCSIIINMQIDVDL